MRRIAAALLVATVLGWSQQISSVGKRQAVDLSRLSTDERIRAYERMLQSNPQDQVTRASLISAYLQKLRESADYHYLDLAQKLVDTMLAQDGGSEAALRFQNEIDLQRHDFRAVAERAESMKKFDPSDPGTFGNLGDALMELGEYDAAGQAYLSMFALRPNLASYNRLAYYRFVTGDANTATELMKLAISAGDAQPEIVAWCWAELGDMYFKTGHLDEAGDAYRSSVRLFPKLHRGIAGLGRVATAQSRYDDAIKCYLRAQAIVPLVEYAAALQDLYATTGQAEKARQQNALISTIEKLGRATNEKTNRNLALALADHNEDLAAALKLLRDELPNRGDVYTWDAMSWVLFKNGDLEEAANASRKALRLGTPEPLFYYHSTNIALACGDKRRAEEYRTRLLALNPRFDVAKSVLP